MNPHVVNILADIATLSEGAKNLVNRLPQKFVAQAADDLPSPTEQAFGEGVDVSEVAALRAKVQLLEMRVRELQANIEAAQDVVMTDIEAAIFRDTFTKRAKDTPQIFLEAVYDLSYFTGLSRSLRPLVAQSLVEITESRNKPVPTLWQRTALTDGAL